MNEPELRAGMPCYLMGYGTKEFVITDIRDDLFPIGVAPEGETKATMYVRPMAVKPIILPGHTAN